jgi:hypothetical protein
MYVPETERKNSVTRVQNKNAFSPHQQKINRANGFPSIK